MKFSSVLSLALSINAAIASPLLGNLLQSRAEAILKSLQTLQVTIHADVAAINASIAQVPPNATEEEKNASAADIQVAFQRMIGNVKTATRESRPFQVKTRDIAEVPRDVDLQPIVSGIFNALQAIVQDVILVIKTALEFLNTSAVLQELAGALVNGILALLNTILVTILAIPGSDKIRELINAIIKLIPL